MVPESTHALDMPAKCPPRSPTVKALVAVFGDKAREAKRILRMSRTELAALPAGEARIRECYHPPATSDVRMECLNALAETHGVEAFKVRNGDWCEYLNGGDTYTATLVHFRGSYRVASWGDIAERFGTLN